MTPCSASRCRETPGELDDDDHHWKAGRFYVHRNDRRIPVPKRLGFGRTPNLARPVSWAMFAAPIVIGVIVAVNEG
jgi:uncharacterized membrane protein